MDLDEAARSAQVPRAVAEALESEDFSHFASPVYAKSFLMQYSGFLGVDAQTWLDALEPGSFMASGLLVRREEAPRAKTDDADAGRGGVIPVFILVLAAAAVVVGAIKGCEMFEDKLEGNKPAASSKRVE